MKIKPIPPNPELDALIERARDHKMTPEEIDAQRRSWVRGNVGLAYPDMPAERLDALMRLALGPSLAEQLTIARREARNKALEEAARHLEEYRAPREEYGHAKAAVMLDAEAIRALKEEG